MTPKHVHVKVEHRLVPLAAVGLQQGKARRIEGLAHRERDPLGGAHRRPGLLRGQIEQGHRMAFAGDQHVPRVDLAPVLRGSHAENRRREDVARTPSTGAFATRSDSFGFFVFG